MPLVPAQFQPAIVPPSEQPANLTVAEQALASLSPEERQATLDARRRREAEEAQQLAAQAEQRRLEEENSRIGTFGLQAARGALSALTAPGALLAAGAEGLGSLLGSDALEKIGRDIGESATGEEAIKALAFAGKSAVKDTEAGISAYDAAQQKLDDQQKAWPSLSAVSNLAGYAAFGLAAGAGAGMATGATRAAATIGLGAAEGAAGGAQAAYEEAAPIRDVLASAVLGGLLGTAAAGLGEGIAVGARSLARRITPETEEAIQALARGEAPAVGAATEGAAEAVDKMASRFGTKAFVDRQSELRKIIGRRGIVSGRERVEQVTNDVLNYVDPDTGERILQDPKKFFSIRDSDEIPEALERAAEKSGQQVGRMMEQIDQQLGPQGGLDLRDFLLTVKRDVIEPLEQQAKTAAAPEARKALRDVYQRISAENLTGDLRLTKIDPTVGEVPLRVGSKDWWEAVENLEPGQARIGFSKLRAEQQALKSKVYVKPISGVSPPVPRSMLDLQKLERTYAGYLEDQGADALERAGLGATTYRDTMRTHGSLRIAADASKTRAQALQGNNMFSLTDFISGGAGITAGAVLGGAPGAAIMGIAGAMGRKWLRENGNALAAVQLQRLSQALRGDVSRGAQLFGRALSAGRETLRMAERGGAVAAAGAAAPIALTASEQWNQRRKAIDRMATDPDAVIAAVNQAPGIPDQMVPEAIHGAQSRLAQLIQDLPRTRKDIRGAAYEKLSSNDVRLANAMYEATMNPMSIFNDYRRGVVDYDKVKYVWKQYPGLKQASQAAIVDMLTAQMDDASRLRIPNTTLTQIDFFFGFNGTLQPSVSAALSSNMTAAAGPQQQPEQQQGRPLGKLPSTTKTPIGRMMAGTRS